MFSGDGGGCGFKSCQRHQRQRPPAQTAKPSAVRSQRLCLRPPYVPFSRTVIVGMSEPGSEANAVRRFNFRPLSVLLAGTPQSDRGRIALARFRSSAKMRQSSEWTSGPGCGEAASRHLRSNSHKSKTITITIPMPSMLFITLTRASCNNN